MRRLMLIVTNVCFILTSFSVHAATDSDTSARQLTDAAGVSRGLCVQLGLRDGKLLAALQKQGFAFANGIALDPKLETPIRKELQKGGLYGEEVSVHYMAVNALPYTDNLINLIVADDFNALSAKGLTLEEILRVLVPRGVAMLKNAELSPEDLKGLSAAKTPGDWTRIEKPRPEGLGDWSHYDCDAAGSRVLKDSVVSLPRRMQFNYGKPWKVFGGAELGGGLGLAVNGRRFCFEGRDSATPRRSTSPKGKLGPAKMFLVARDGHNGLLLWEKELPGPKDPRTNCARGYPRDRFVADADALYLVWDGKLTAVDAATGTIRKIYPVPAREVGGQLRLYKDHLLFGGRCLNTKTGQEKWRGGVSGKKMVVGDDKVFASDGRESLSCGDFSTGKLLWKTELEGKCTLRAYHNGVVVMVSEVGKDAGVLGYSADTGKKLWQLPFPKPYHRGNHSNVFYVKGLLWLKVLDSDILKKLNAFFWRKSPKGRVKVHEVVAGAKMYAPVNGRSIGFQHTGYWGVDIKTGKIVKRIDIGGGGDNRCFQDCATERFLIWPTCSFSDPETRTTERTFITRGNCGLGQLVGNGLLYGFSIGCTCGPFIHGYSAFAPGPENEMPARESAPALERGPGFGTTESQSADTGGAEDWPMYRHDPGRSVWASTSLKPGLDALWTADLGGRLTPPVAAGGRVIVAVREQNRVVCLDGETGQTLWTFFTGGRVDSPPSCFQNLVIFGCRDGWVYCVRASDGALVWRFFAALKKRWIMDHGQLESAWPVIGSVVIRDRKVLFAAGRHSALDGGIRVYAVAPHTGKVLWKTFHYRADRNASHANMLVGQGKIIAVGSAVFDMEDGELLKLDEHRASLSNDKVLKSARPDGEYYLRTAFKSSYGALSGGKMRLPGGGWQRKVGGLLLAWNSKALFTVDADPKRRRTYKNRPVHQPGDVFTLRSRGKSSPGFSAKEMTIWGAKVPLKLRSLIGSGEHLFVAGAPSDNAKTTHGELWTFSAKDGKRVSTIRIEAPPVPDGLAAARGKMFVSLKNGKVLCLGPSK